MKYKIFILLLIVCITSVSFAELKENAREDKTLNYLIKTLSDLKVYQKRYPQFPACVEYITDEITDSYIEVTLREKHDGANCKGDPDTAPTLDIYKIMNTKPMKIYWLDRVNDKYLPIKDSLDSIK